MSRLCDELLQKIRTGEAGHVSLRGVFERASAEDLEVMTHADISDEEAHTISEAIEKAELSDYVRLVFGTVTPPHAGNSQLDNGSGTDSNPGSAPAPDSGAADHSNESGNDADQNKGNENAES